MAFGCAWSSSTSAAVTSALATGWMSGEACCVPGRVVLFGESPGFLHFLGQSSLLKVTML